MSAHREGDLIVGVAVTVGVLIAEGLQHGHPLVHSGGSFQSETVQPVLADNKSIGREIGRLDHRVDGIDVSVRRSQGLGIGEILVRLQDVFSVDVNVILQRKDHSLRSQLRKAQSVREQHDVRQIAAAGRDAQLHDFHVLRRRRNVPVDFNVCAALNLLPHRKIVRKALYVAVRGCYGDFHGLFQRECDLTDCGRIRSGRSGGSGTARFRRSSAGGQTQEHCRGNRPRGQPFQKRALFHGCPPSDWCFFPEAGPVCCCLTSDIAYCMFCGLVCVIIVATRLFVSQQFILAQHTLSRKSGRKTIFPHILYPVQKLFVAAAFSPHYHKKRKRLLPQTIFNRY